MIKKNNLTLNLWYTMLYIHIFFYLRLAVYIFYVNQAVSCTVLTLYDFQRESQPSYIRSAVMGRMFSYLAIL